MFDAKDYTLKQLKYFEKKYNCKFEITADLGSIRLVKITAGKSLDTEQILRKLNLAIEARFGLRFWLDTRKKGNEIRYLSLLYYNRKEKKRIEIYG